MSGFFLFLIAAFNVVILAGIVTVFRKMRQGAYDNALEEQLNNRGLLPCLNGDPQREGEHRPRDRPYAESGRVQGGQPHTRATASRTAACCGPAWPGSTADGRTWVRAWRNGRSR